MEIVKSFVFNTISKFFQLIPACDSEPVLPKQTRVAAASKLKNEKIRRCNEAHQLTSIPVAVARKGAFGLVEIEHGVIRTAWRHLNATDPSVFNSALQSWPCLKSAQPKTSGHCAAMRVPATGAVLFNRCKTQSEMARSRKLSCKKTHVPFAPFAVLASPRYYMSSPSK